MNYVPSALIFRSEGEEQDRTEQGKTKHVRAGQGVAMCSLGGDTDSCVLLHCTDALQGVVPDRLSNNCYFIATHYDTLSVDTVTDHSEVRLD